ncbi:MAG: SNF2-related protein [Actinomycetota bacterium]|nr:SNF2-related protein [Actinomycetota bacterium]
MSVLDWPSTLHPFQIEGVCLLVRQPEVLLADDMGLGKTIQTIAALRLLLWRGEAEAALVVVPAGLVTQWRRELGSWAPELRVSTVRGSASMRAGQWAAPAHVFLTTYETVRSDMSPHPHSGPRRHCWDVVVLDEAQRIKNREAGVSAACKMLPRRRSWALSGTPLENSIEDLASIVEFLQPNPSGDPPTPVRVGPGLREMHSRLQLRRRKQDVLRELPPKTVIDVTLDLSDEQRESYDRAEHEGVVELRQRGETLRITHVLSLITRLKQICNVCPRTGSSAKLDDLERRLTDLSEQGHKMLVFTQFADEIFGALAITDRLSRFGALAYTGSLAQPERDEVIARFKNSDSRRALVLSLRAGGQGLNLQEASYVAHFDRWWNPAVERQAEDRSHRMGQRFPVTVYTYTMAGTIEERIARLLEEKRRLFKLVIDDVTLDLSSVLSASELFGLFDLPVPGAIRAEGEIEVDSFAGMTGREFEEWTEDLFRKLGFSVELTPASRDGGVDLVARSRDVVGVETTLYVQCKNHVSPIGVEPMRALVGCLPSGDPGSRAVMICPSGFTADASAFGTRRGVQLIDAMGLATLQKRASSGSGSRPTGDGCAE